MDVHDIALATAGVIGSAGAIFHGVLTQKLMVAPFGKYTGPHVSGVINRIVPLLLHFSTYNWLLGGIALIVAATMLDASARCAVAALVASSYAFAALGNLWGTRTIHPGWVLYTIALGLIGFGLAR